MGISALAMLSALAKSSSSHTSAMQRPGANCPVVSGNGVKEKSPMISFGTQTSENRMENDLIRIVLLWNSNSFVYISCFPFLYSHIINMNLFNSFRFCLFVWKRFFLILVEGRNFCSFHHLLFLCIIIIIIFFFLLFLPFPPPLIIKK